MSSTVSSTELLSGTIKRRMSGLEVKLKSEPLEALFKFAANDRMSPDEATVFRDPFAEPTDPSRPPSSRPSAPKKVSWGPTRHYMPDIGENGVPRALPGFTIGRFDMWGNRELLLAPRSPRFNLSILLAVGLGSERGMDIVIPTVLSPTALDQYIEGLNIGVRQLYIDFLKESTANIRITTDSYVTS